MIQSLSGAANENEYAGTIVWQLWHKDIIYDVLTRYDFTYNASGTAAFLEQVDYANARVCCSKSSRTKTSPTQL